MNSNNYNILNLKRFPFVFLNFFFYRYIICEISIKHNFKSGTLDESNNYFLDIKDYYNLSIIITESKKIYKGIPPNYQATTNASINKFSSAVTYNTNYLLVACLDDSLLTKININTGNNTSLLDYPYKNSTYLPEYYCSISLLDNIVYITITTNSTDQNKYKLIHKAFKIFLDNNSNEDEGPNFNDSKNFSFPSEYDKLNMTRQIICETIENESVDFHNLFCLYAKKGRVTGALLNKDFESIEKEKDIIPISSIFSYKLYKLNLYKLKILFNNFICYISIKYENGKLNISKIRDGNSQFIQNATNDCYDYNNNYLVKVSSEIILTGSKYEQIKIFNIYNKDSKDFYKIYDLHIKKLNKLMISYKENEDNFLCIYLDNTTLKYFSLNNTKEIYNIEQKQKTIEIESYKEITFNVSYLFEKNNNSDLIDIYSYKKYTFASVQKYTEINYRENKGEEYFIFNNQNITQKGSKNNWIEYSFCFRYRDPDFLIEFLFYTSTLKIQTCSSQCLSCNFSYTKCDECRDFGDNIHYAKLNGSDDNSCYNSNQNILGYIYDSGIFEPCFNTCKFCSQKAELSSQSKQNCLACKDEYFPSFEYQGNCYKIKEGENNLDKIVNNTDDIFFTAKSCPDDKPFKISLTRECVSFCPNTSIYNENNYINFTEKNNNNELDNQYILSKNLVFNYEINKTCYDEYPENLNSDEKNENYCPYAWHKDSNNRIYCYEENYCHNKEYKYYIEDTRECLKNGCPEGYYQFYFQCYKNNCPSGTEQILNESHKCQSIYNFCYINEHFQSICNNTQDNEYILKFNNTKQYLRSCNDSLIYTIEESKSYLYNGNCFLECPDDLLKKDDENDKCICKYGSYYEGDQLICFDNPTTCENKTKVIDNNECLDSFTDCIKKNYSIFNNFCYKNGCPPNTKSYINTYLCQCSYFYYNNTENNILNCFEQSENCYSQNYSYLNPESLECFNSLDECFIKGNLFFFNNNCYKSKCPENQILLTNIVNQTIKDNLLEILNIDQKLENKICTCNDLSSVNFMLNNEYNGTQLCIINPLEEYEKNCIQKIYPEEYYSNPDYCHFIYQNKCMTYAPNNTCVSQDNTDLICSVEIKLDMKVFNFICFNNFLEIENNVINISYGNFPISTSENIFIFVYDNTTSLDETLENYTSISILYLNQCEDKLREKYNLLPDEHIFILGVDTPNLIKQSATSVYNYEIFLQNGTQIEDLSICNDTDLTLSSPIIDEELIHYKEAVHFASMGYNIYDINDKFYHDFCTPASINDNDITLSDRYKDFYPTNISFCNDTCKFSYMNLTSKRVVCLCQPFNFEINDNDDENEIDYSNYLLSLINYKIIVCYDLFFDIKNYYNNYGFFIGIGGFGLYIIESIIFITMGIKLLKKQLIENIPSKKERIDTIKNNLNKNSKNNIKNNRNEFVEHNKQMKEANKDSININNNLNDNNHNIINNPPRKRINIFNLQNENSTKNFDKVNEHKPINKNRFKAFHIIKKKRSKSTYIKSKKEIPPPTKKFGRQLNNIENNNLSVLEGIEKSKSTLNNKSDEILYKNSSNKIDPLIHYNNYIIIDDNSVDKKEINNVPFTQALRIDKRHFFDIYLSVLYNEIKFINMFYYKNPYVHISLPISIYIFSELLDFGINCFLYSDDEVSEKYHNNGSLKAFTSLSLSFTSNLFSNIIVFIISKLTNFSEIMEIMIKDVRNPEYYKWNVVRITKYTKIKLFIHYFIQFLLILFIIYYLFIFCTVYHNSQISAGLNYLVGIFESFGISIFLSLITSIMRFLGLRYKNSRLYNISKYFYQHF